MRDYEKEYWEAQAHIDFLEMIIKAAEAVLAAEPDDDLDA